MLDSDTIIKIMKTMYKKIINSLLVLITSVTLTSCADVFGDFLDKQPSNELTEQMVFDSWALMRQYHQDTYKYLRNGVGRLNGSWLDAATDLSITSFSSGGTRTTFNVGNYFGAGRSTSAYLISQIGTTSREMGFEGFNDELVGTWEHYYTAIRKTNNIITRIDFVPKDPAASDTQHAAEKREYTSEARFLRAYFYWELFLRYGPVPIVKVPLNPNDGDALIGNYGTRPTVKEYVVDFILEELKGCEDGLLTYADAWTTARAGRIGKPMARALCSRIMLYMASPRFSTQSGITWQEAADAAKSFIDTYGANFQLFTVPDGIIHPYTNALLRTAYTGNNREVIFYRNDNTSQWRDIRDDTPVGEGGNGGNCPSQNLIDMYDMLDGSSPFAQYDVTGAPVYNSATNAPEINPTGGYDAADPWANRDPRLAATVLLHGVRWGNGVINVIHGKRDNPIGNANATPTGYYMRKYIPEAILAAEHSQRAYRLWTIIRYAEILLNYAEALNESQGPGEEVYNALDIIRSRAGITGSVADRSDLTSSKENMRNFIRKERTVEFAFEEHRPWDVRRWNVAVEALSRPIYGVDVNADGTITRKITQNRVFQERMYLYPIPEGEIWKTDIANNPGW
jgi:hypothetical protein